MSYGKIFPLGGSGGSTSPSGIAGAIQFSNGSAFASDAANLFWDDTNNRLGIGTNAPAYPLEVNGTAKIQSFEFIGGDVFASTNIRFFPTNGISINKDYSYALANTLLHIKGSGSTSATTSLLVQNSAGRTALKVADNGVVTIGADDKSGEQLAFVGLYGTRLRILTNSSVDGITGSVINSALDFTSNDLILSSKAASTTSNVYVIPTSFTSLSGSVLVNTTTDVASSVLTLNSTTKGFLPPRMTTTQRDAIVTPATGLKIYNTTLGTTDTYDGATWQRFGQQTLIKGSGTTSSTNSLVVQNSAGNTALQVLDDSRVVLGNASDFAVYSGSGITSRYAMSIGTTSLPTATLQVKGSGSTSATTSLLIQNSAGTEAFRVRDDNNILVNGGSIIGVGTLHSSAVATGYINSAGNAFSVMQTNNSTGSARFYQSVMVGYTSEPTSRLQVVGSGSTSATTALLVQNSAGTNLLTVLDNGAATLNGNTTVTGFLSVTQDVGLSNTVIFWAGGYQIRNTANGIVFTGATGAATGALGLGMTTGTGINASCILQADSTTKGFLPPRMTTAQKNAIATPANGLMVYDTDLARPCFFNGATWITL